jgi:hypothetical protein
VVESAIIPTLAYVAGPGELAYWAQLGGLFGAHGLRAPLVAPRHGALLVESKVGKVLDKFQLSSQAKKLPAPNIAGKVEITSVFRIQKDPAEEHDLASSETPGGSHDDLDLLRSDLHEPILTQPLHVSNTDRGGLGEERAERSEK